MWGEEWMRGETDGRRDRVTGYGTGARTDRRGMWTERPDQDGWLGWPGREKCRNKGSEERRGVWTEGPDRNRWLGWPGREKYRNRGSEKRTRVWTERPDQDRWLGWPGRNIGKGVRRNGGEYERRDEGTGGVVGWALLRSRLVTLFPGRKETRGT